MKTLTINTLCGIKNQLYCQDQSVSSGKEVEIHDNYYDINSLFWSEIFDPQHILELVERAQKELRDDKSPKIKAILQQPDVFIETCFDALNSFDMEAKEKELFQKVETLEILCLLHTKLFSKPFVLTVSQGYILSKFSALDMKNTCLLPFCNPYLDFIKLKIMPQILKYQPDILVFSGVPNLASFAIARLVRLQLPDVFIISNGQESEYYSLRKIRHLLRKNSAFFSVYDCAVITDHPSIITSLEHWYCNKSKNTINNIPDIIYSLDEGENIIETQCMSNLVINSSTDLPNKNINVCNIRAFPHNHCYWNKCSFCGINAKYSMCQNQKWDVPKAGSTINSLYNKGAQKIWLLDEAIPPSIMIKLANYLICHDIKIAWHARTRIEPELIDKKFIQTLALSGLKHILFGFESASDRILKLMEKNRNDFNYLEIAEQLVNEFTANGIKVHFSAILGFPTETEEERHRTTDFLQYLYENNNLFSYNLNIFYLDIGSKIYNKWECFDIISLAFPCAPKYFLENHLDWIGSVNPQQNTSIREDQEVCMKKQFTWYPEGTLINPSTFFAFWEYSRYTLSENVNANETEPLSIRGENKIVLSKWVCQCQLADNSWMLYHLKNHHYVVGGAILRDLLTASRHYESFRLFIDRYPDKYKQRAENLVSQLARKMFFVCPK